MTARRNVALAASSALILGVMTLPTVASASTQAKGEHPLHRVTFIVGCHGNDTKNAPKALELDCKLGLRSVSALKWTNWGAASATATGTYELTYRGRLYTYPVKVQANMVKKREATQVYSAAHITFTGTMPKGMKRTTTVKFPLP